jgi:aconitate hydratase
MKLKQITSKIEDFSIIDLEKVSKKFSIDVERLPISLKILFENSLRNSKSEQDLKDNVAKFSKYLGGKAGSEISYSPARVLMQDFTGVPAVVDLAAMLDAILKGKKDPSLINPLIPVDLVIDHSIQVDEYANKSALEENTKLEIQRNIERYEFLKWGQESFENFRVVPPGMGICHQVNIEYLASVVAKKEIDGEEFLIPDTLVGTDSHTTMVNSLGIVGWGVGGIEAEAAMLGREISLLLPEIVGFKLTGKLPEGVTATDLVLTITEKLREVGVVGKFIEFHGAALSELSLADRATISNMTPEFGATVTFFPTDDNTIKYLELTNRDKKQIELVKEYCKSQGLYRDDKSEVKYSSEIELDLSKVVASIAGPARPQDRLSLPEAPKHYLSKIVKKADIKPRQVKGADYELENGNIVIAAITSCTNTSNPSVMIAAGLVARKALALGLAPKPYVKTSLAPGSKAVSAYLANSGLQKDLDAFGFNIVGYGCTTCIGNSGPLLPEIEECIRENDLNMASMLSGNRNFAGRIHPLVKSNYLASPPLVVAYSILGKITSDISSDVLGQDKEGRDVYLKDLWPSNKEIEEIVQKNVTRELFAEKYKDIFLGAKQWQDIEVSASSAYQWNEKSTYVRLPTFFEDMDREMLSDIEGASILALFGDSITTDHISPAGAIAKTSPAAEYLKDKGIERKDFNSYGSRRGNHEVMMRGTFANIRINNDMVESEGGYTKHVTSGEEMSIYDAAMEYKKEQTPLVIIAGKEYGTGSSRDWAAKGTLLLGVKAVIAKSYERIHRSNLVGMGVVPLMFKKGEDKDSLKLTGDEKISILGIGDLEAQGEVDCVIDYADGKKKEIKLVVRIDTEDELEFFKDGGILQSVVKGALEG